MIHARLRSLLNHSHLFINTAPYLLQLTDDKVDSERKCSLLENRWRLFHTASRDFQPLLSSSSNSGAHLTVILYIQPEADEAGQGSPYVCVCAHVCASYLFP